jgi:hypothetical protein
VSHLAFWLHSIWHPLENAGYQFWSGLGSDLGYIAGLIALWRHLNCGAPRCLRIGRHPTADGQHHLCRKHHPDLANHKPSLAEIRDRHQQAKDRQ